MNRKNKIILKNLKEQVNKSVKSVEPFLRESTQIKHIIRNKDEDLTELAKMKYFIDSLSNDGESQKEDFNPENYRKCSECFSIVEA